MPEFYFARSAVRPQEGKPSVFIATPAITIGGAHMASVIKALPRVMNAGVAVDHYLLMNGCHVDDMRNICVGAFLKGDCDHLLFIDADVGFTPEGLYRICTHEGDIVAGVYPRKQMARSYPLTFEEDVLATDEHGLIKQGVLTVPAGFLRISRRVLERMAEIRLDRSFRSNEAGEAVPLIFERTLKDGQRCSGDVAFCMWARELGYEITVDAFQEFIHEGPARFIGCLAKDFAEPAEKQEERVNGAG